MKRWGVLVLAACVMGTSACGDDDDSPAAPSNQPIVFTATLAAASEVPPITNAESAATGDARITITPTRDSANAITGGTVEMAFTVRNMPASGNIILAHIHTG